MHRIRDALLLFFLLRMTASPAQSVYELTYQFRGDSTKTIYKGLMFRKADNTGFLRLTALHPKTGKRVLYDFSISLNEYDFGNMQLDAGLPLLADDSTRYWYCWSENFNLKEGKEIYDFDFLRLWFRQEKGTKEILPSTHTVFNAEGRYLGFFEEPSVSKRAGATDSSGNLLTADTATGILNFKLLKQTGFTKAYLSRFFIPGELFREGTYTKAQVVACRNNVRPSLHLINVINSRDADISANCVEDGKATSEYFKNIAEFLELRFTEKKLTGANFSITAVRNAIQQLRPGKDDIVVFFYSGHGFRWKGDLDYPFPQMGLYYGVPPSWNHMGAFSMNLEDVYKAIRKKGARLNLVLGDLCNTIVNRRRSEIQDTTDISMMPGLVHMNRRTVSTLFLQTRASILVSAAELGQEANCSRIYNGFFTSSLFSTFTEILYNPVRDPQWTDIIRLTNAKTADLAMKYGREQQIIYKYCPEAATGNCQQYLGRRNAAK